MQRNRAARAGKINRIGENLITGCPQEAVVAVDQARYGFSQSETAGWDHGLTSCTSFLRQTPSASPVREASIRRQRRRMVQERPAFRMSQDGTIMITDKDMVIRERQC
jgi:hypothetical protein